MKLMLASLAWLTIAAVLGTGIYLSVIPNGTPWLLVIAVIGFIVAVGAIGCKQ